MEKHYFGASYSKWTRALTFTFLVLAFYTKWTSTTLALYSKWTRALNFDGLFFVFENGPGDGSSSLSLRALSSQAKNSEKSVPVLEYEY